MQTRITAWIIGALFVLALAFGSLGTGPATSYAADPTPTPTPAGSNGGSGSGGNGGH